MSTPFQNRLVGTVIVAAIAIIFLPDLLDGDKKTYQEQFEKIPAAPKVDFQPKNHRFPQETLTALAQEEISDEVALDDEPITDTAGSEATKMPDNGDKVKVNVLTKAVDEENVVESLPEKTPPLPSTAIANEAWVIQLGSFRHKNNVDELVNKLTQAGYSAFTRPIKTKTGTLTKVFVGPELIKASLEKKIPALKTLTNVEGKIAKFSPTKK